MKLVFVCLSSSLIDEINFWFQKIHEIFLNERNQSQLGLETAESNIPSMSTLKNGLTCNFFFFFLTHYNFLECTGNESCVVV